MKHATKIRLAGAAIGSVVGACMSPYVVKTVIATIQRVQRLLNKEGNR